MKLRPNLVSHAALAAGLTLASQATAQDRPAPTPSRPTSAAPGAADAPPQQDTTRSAGLEDIIVTARRVAENQQNVPVAVTVFSGAQLQQQNAVLVRDVALLTPGLYAKEGNSARSAINLSLRGQIQADVVATLDPSVGTYVDGYYWARAYGINADLLDIQSVQTLKGPQGTLFGRNTTGGALLIQTNDPTFKGIGGSVMGTYGRFNERSATGVLNVPLIDDKLALRAAVSFRKRDGYIRNSFTGVDFDNANSLNGRVKLLIKPTENFSVVLGAEFFRTDDRPQPFRLGYISPTRFAVINGTPTPFDGLATLSYGLQNGLNPVAAKAALDAIVASSGASDTYGLNGLTSDYAKTQTYTGVATLDTYFGAVKFIGGYRKVQARSPLDLDGTSTTFLHTGPITGREYQQDLDQYSGELQITGKTADKAIEFAAGLIYFHEAGNDGSQSTAIPLLNPNNPTVYDGTINNDSQGVYAQSTWHATSRLSLTGGLRYSIEDKGLTLHNRTFAPAANGFVCTLAGTTPPGCTAARHDSFSGVSYTAGADYKLAQDVLVYAKTSKGFRSGGENLQATGVAGVTFQPFKSEISFSHEVGIKSEFFDRRLRVNIAAYYSTIKDIQKTTFVASGNGVAQTLGNAGKERVYGGEIEVNALLFDGFRLAATGAITQPKYLDYFDGVRDRRSDRIAYVPRYTATVSGIYSHPIGGAKLTLRSDVIYNSKTDLSNYNDVTDPNNAGIIAATISPSYVLVNARAAVSFDDDRFELAVFGRNLTDNRDIINGFVVTPPVSFAVNQRREPRTFGVTGSFKFGAF